MPNIGASGAIAGVLGGYLLLFPRARVMTVIFIIFFFTLIELPALVFLGFWFVQQVLFGYFDLTDPTGGGGGVAYFAHIGGFVFGLLAISAVRRRRASAGGSCRPAACGPERRADRGPRRGARLHRRCSAFLTLFVLFTSGPDVLVVVSLLVRRACSALGVIGGDRRGRSSVPYRSCQGGRASGGGAGRGARRVALVVLAAVAVAAALALRGPRRAGARAPRRGARRAHAARRPDGGAGRSRAAARRRRRSPCGSTTRATRVRVRFKHPPRAGLLFDLDTGRVLWRRNPTRVLPIASLTKMMTALLVADRAAARRRASRITAAALRYQGSGVGLLPRGQADPRRDDAARPAAAVGQRRRASRWPSAPRAAACAASCG